MILSAFQVLLIAIWFLTVGAIVTVGSVMLYECPENHRRWGAVITVFSILGGGFVGLVGGARALPIEKITRICPQCGIVLKEDPSVRFCSFCGKNLEILAKKEKKES